MQIEAVAIFIFIIFGAHMSTLFVMKVRILVLMKWSCRFAHNYVCQ